MAYGTTLYERHPCGFCARSRREMLVGDGLKGVNLTVLVV